MKLNLGCGKDILKGYINCDYQKNRGVDMVLNLEDLPLPFKDDSVTEILMQDIFEHLSNPLKILEELYRISKNKCLLKIRVPHFSSNSAWGDLTHKRGFSSKSFDHFIIGNTSSSLESNRIIKFRLVKKELQFTRIYRALGFNTLFSKFSKIYESYFHGFFPCSNIYFELEVLKPSPKASL